MPSQTSYLSQFPQPYGSQSLPLPDDAQEGFRSSGEGEPVGIQSRDAATIRSQDFGVRTNHHRAGIIALKTKPQEPLPHVLGMRAPLQGSEDKINLLATDAVIVRPAFARDEPDRRQNRSTSFSERAVGALKVVAKTLICPKDHTHHTLGPPRLDSHFGNLEKTSMNQTSVRDASVNETEKVMRVQPHSKPNTDPFDEELLTKIEHILQSCSIHRVCVSFQYVKVNSCSPETTLSRVLTWQTERRKTQPALVSSAIDSIFHVASLSRMLIATAVVHAIEVKAVEDVAYNQWSKFKEIAMVPIRDVYNKSRKNSEPKMEILPGDPSIYELMLHSKGLPSIDNCMLAPDGTPLTNLQDLPRYLTELLRKKPEHKHSSKRWTNYSNTNFAVIALTIETLWGGCLHDFMEETLFRPLRMYSTSISFRFCQHAHPYEPKATGAELAAIGAYSTIRDLDVFFSSMIHAYHDREPYTMKGLSKTIDRLHHMENTHIEGFLHYTPFGLYTKLSDSTIGLSSKDDLRYPRGCLGAHPIVPGLLGQEYSLHYMTESSEGSCYATALRVHETDNFAVTVLADSSCRVNIANETLRLVLRALANMQSPAGIAQCPEHVGARPQ